MTQTPPPFVSNIAQQPTNKLGGRNTDISRTVARTVNDFAPQGWYLLQKAEGDLNGDNQPDIVAIFSKSDPQARKYDERQSDEELEAPRLLTVALRDDNNQLQRVAESDRAVLCRGCGGMLDEPLVNLTIAHGVIDLEQEALGTSDVYYKHTIRNHDGQWLVAGGVESRDRRKGTTHTIHQEKPVLLSEFSIVEASRGQQ